VIFLHDKCVFPREFSTGFSGYRHLGTSCTYYHCHLSRVCSLDDYDETTYYPLRLSIWNRYANAIRQNGRLQHVVWSESRQCRWGGGYYYYFNVACSQILCSYCCLFFLTYRLRLFNWLINTAGLCRF